MSPYPPLRETAKSSVRTLLAELSPVNLYRFAIECRLKKIFHAKTQRKQTLLFASWRLGVRFLMGHTQSQVAIKLSRIEHQTKLLPDEGPAGVLFGALSLSPKALRRTDARADVDGQATRDAALPERRRHQPHLLRGDRTRRHIKGRTHHLPRRDEDTRRHSHARQTRR